MDFQDGSASILTIKQLFLEAKTIFNFSLTPQKILLGFGRNQKKTILFFPERSFYDESSINYLLGQTLVSRVETYSKKINK